ncbi:putative myosin light chain kinase DDB_G0282429 [Oratosquilla oratoria]|uniref:putative myosin light chain kinase DDB_G0282429 n=1 Tax=Oratosquilla oratoria TaxID=337810 RepID=UPI003F757A5F
MIKYAQDFEVFGSVGGLNQEEEKIEVSFTSEFRELFEIRTFLGSGAFGCVHSAVSRSTGEEMAIKSQFVKFCLGAINRELEVLSTLEHHPNDFRFHEVIEDLQNDQVHFVLDLMDLSPEETVNRMTYHGLRFKENEVKSIWLQCLRSLNHIHMAGFVHCDLAPKSILISRIGTVKITDFGLADREEDIVVNAQRGDIIDLSVVFVYIVTQEMVEDFKGLENKVSSAGVELVEQMFFGKVLARESLTSAYFGENPSPQRPHIGHILIGNSEDPEEDMDTY